MASVSIEEVSCNCKNTCNRATKRGSCPCRKANKQCTEFCSCGWSVGLPCVNRETRPLPLATRISDEIIDDLASQESDFLETEDEWQPSDTPTRKRKRTYELESSTQSVPVRRRLNIVDLPATKRVRSNAKNNQVPRSTPATQHKEAVENFAAALDETSLRRIVVELLSRDQGAFIDYTSGYRPGEEPPSSPPPPPQSQQPPWCRCGNCRPMATAQENKCCMTRGVQQCATEAENFYLVVDPAVLDLAMAFYNDFMAHDQVRDNASYRHQAYKQYVLQRHGRLGAGNRRVVPSCVVMAIRQRFPDPNGHYTGFIGH